MISKNVRGWCVLQRYDAAWQSEGQYFTHKEQQSRNKTRYLTKLGLLLVFTTVLVTTPQFITVSRRFFIVRSQQHGLLHGKRLLCVPVVWSSKQLGELLPHDRLLLLELCPVVMQAVWVVWKSELLNRRHLGSLEAGRAGHPTRGLRGQVIVGPWDHVYGPPRPAFWKVVRVRLGSSMALEPVVHRSVDLCGGGELLQVDWGGPPLGFQLQGVLWGRPGVTGVVGGARGRLPAVGGVGVVHESLLWGKAVGLPLGGGVRSFPVRHTGWWGKSGGRSVKSVLSSVVQIHTVGGMEDGDLCCSSAGGLLLRRGVVLALAARVASLDSCWTVVGKWMRKRMFGHPWPWCDWHDAPSQTRSTAGAALMEGWYTERCITARGPHSGRRSLKLQDLEFLLWQPRNVVVLGGIGASVGAGEEALGARPSMVQSTVFWTGRGWRRPSAQPDFPGCRSFGCFQLSLGGFEPAGSDLLVRAGGCVGVVVGGGMALRLPSIHHDVLWCRDGGWGWRCPPLRRSWGWLLSLLVGDLPWSSGANVPPFSLVVADMFLQRVPAWPARGPTVPLTVWYRTRVPWRLGWLGMALTVGHVIRCCCCCCRPLRRKLPERLLGKLVLFTCKMKTAGKTLEHHQQAKVNGDGLTHCVALIHIGWGVTTGTWIHATPLP